LQVGIKADFLKKIVKTNSVSHCISTLRDVNMFIRALIVILSNLVLIAACTAHFLSSSFGFDEREVYN
jgi:hypothetical protein